RFLAIRRAQLGLGAAYPRRARTGRLERDHPQLLLAPFQIELKRLEEIAGQSGIEHHLARPRPQTDIDDLFRRERSSPVVGESSREGDHSALIIHSARSLTTHVFPS